MKRYIALLRGINISGKNKITMSSLKDGFENLGFENVVTYLNSGNVVYSSELKDEAVLSTNIKSMVKEMFGLDIPVFVVSQEEVKALLNMAPDWWGDDSKEIYDNLIFMMPPLTYEEFYEEVKDPKVEYEKAHHVNQVVFWSFRRKYYQKTNWWSKTASSNISDKITIRTANTVRKIANI